MPKEAKEYVNAEPLERAIESLNKAWEVLRSGEGLAALVSGGALRAGCAEYCGSYDGCTGYCKPMGSARQVLSDNPPPEVEVKGALRMPFGG